MNYPKIVANSFFCDVNYPSEIGSAMFISGCNLRCPYCINNQIVVDINENVELDLNTLLLSLLERREQNVTVSGGEPFMNKFIFNLLEKLKSCGFKVSVCTNGFFPDKIKKAIRLKLVDHIILDIKTSFDRERYSIVTGTEINKSMFSNFIESVGFLKNLELECFTKEFRTTCCSKFVSKEDIFSIAYFLGKKNIYFLQPFTTHQTLNKELDDKYIIPYSTLEEWAEELDESVVKKCLIRDV